MVASFSAVCSTVSRVDICFVLPLSSLLPCIVFDYGKRSAHFLSASSIPLFVFLGGSQFLLSSPGVELAGPRGDWSRVRVPPLPLPFICAILLLDYLVLMWLDLLCCYRGCGKERGALRTGAGGALLLQRRDGKSSFFFLLIFQCPR